MSDSETTAGDTDSIDDPSGVDEVAEHSIDSARRGELIEERDFLLKSLDDLQREYDAGDLDDDDYSVLRDGYTARAAEVLRELESGTEPVTHGRGRNWKPALIAIATTVAIFAALWWGLSTFSAQRLPDQNITGVDPRSERQQMLSRAYQVQLERPGEAATIYALVLEEYPDDVEALTYGGWTRALAVVRSDIDSETKVDELSESARMLTEAIELDPTYPDPRCLRGVLYGRFLEQPELAGPDLDECLALNPPADMRDLIGGLRDELSTGSVPPVSNNAEDESATGSSTIGSATGGSSATGSSATGSSATWPPIATMPPEQP